MGHLLSWYHMRQGASGDLLPCKHHNTSQQLAPYRQQAYFENHSIVIKHGTTLELPYR